MKNKHLLLFVILSVALLSLNACSGSGKFDIDISDINLNIKFHRLDQDLLNTDTSAIAQKIPELQSKYGSFLDLYNFEIVKIGGTNEKGYADNLKQFLAYCKNYKLDENINTQYADFSKTQNEITDAFKRFHYYFPQNPVPEVYTYISGFQPNSVVTTDKELGINLDNYLGINSPYYKDMAIETYKRTRMYKEMIPADCMRAWAYNQFTVNDSVSNVLCSMIYEGRNQYLLDALLPQTPDTVKWGYTAQQMDWAMAYEENVWKYIIESKVLFSINAMDIRTYTGEGPFTSVFGNYSCPRAGVWIGYKIVKAYMEKNKKVTIKDLMYERDYQKILNFSKYKPD